MMSRAQQVWIDGLNGGDVSAADSAFAKECVVHINGSPDPNLSVAGFQEMMRGLLAAFPDLRLSITDQVVAGDRVATRWAAQGTNTGPFGPVPATGREVRVHGIILDRMSGDRIVERWEQWDQAGMMQQLGLG